MKSAWTRAESRYWRAAAHSFAFAANRRQAPRPDPTSLFPDGEGEPDKADEPDEAGDPDDGVMQGSGTEGAD